MNKKMIRIFAIVMAIAMALSLTACGRKNEPYTHKVDMGGYTLEMTSVDYVLSEYLSEDETIWYLLDEDKGKSSDVEMIFVINPDGTLYYVDRVKYTLGELEQMADADIIAMVEEGYRQAALKKEMKVNLYNRESAYEYLYFALFWERFTDMLYYSNNDFSAYFESNPVLAEAVEPVKDSLEDVYAAFWDMLQEINRSENVYDMMFILEELLCTIQAYRTVSVEEICAGMRNEYAGFPGSKYVMDELDAIFARIPAVVEAVYNNMLQLAETIYKEIQPTPYRMSILTDSTGNYTASVQFAYLSLSAPDGYGTGGFKLYYQYPITTSEEITTNCTTVVYDSVYGGYRTDHGLFYTRINTNAHFMLDQVGQSDLPVDVKNILSLFE